MRIMGFKENLKAELAYKDILIKSLKDMEDSEKK